MEVVNSFGRRKSDMDTVLKMKANECFDHCLSSTQIVNTLPKGAIVKTESESEYDKSEIELK